MRKEQNVKNKERDAKDILDIIVAVCGVIMLAMMLMVILGGCSCSKTTTSTTNMGSDATERDTKVDSRDNGEDSTSETSSTASGEFVSSDNFWQGDDYFDLEGYCWANGAEDVQWKREDASPVMIFNGWRLTLAGSACSVINVHDMNTMMNQETAYYVFAEPGDMTVRVNDTGAMITPGVPALLDQIIPRLKEHGNEVDPFAGTRLTYNM